MADEDALLWMGVGVSAALGAMLLMTMLRDALCPPRPVFVSLPAAFAPSLPLLSHPSLPV